MICGAISAITTILTIVVAVWAAYGADIWMPRHVAVMILVAASLAGLIGLAFASWLSRDSLEN
jgi:CDP-diglyceride synthetase